MKIPDTKMRRELFLYTNRVLEITLPLLYGFQDYNNGTYLL